MAFTILLLLTVILFSDSMSMYALLFLKFIYTFHKNTGADPGFDQGGAPDRDRPKTAILGPQFCRILVLGPHFWWSRGGARAPGPPPWIRPWNIFVICKGDDKFQNSFRHAHLSSRLQNT